MRNAVDSSMLCFTASNRRSSLLEGVQADEAVERDESHVCQQHADREAPRQDALVQHGHAERVSQQHSDSLHVQHAELQLLQQRDKDSQWHDEEQPILNAVLFSLHQFYHNTYFYRNAYSNFITEHYS